MDEIVDKKCPNSAYHELDNMRQPHQNTSFNMNLFLCISMAYTVISYIGLEKHSNFENRWYTMHFGECLSKSISDVLVSEERQRRRQ